MSLMILPPQPKNALFGRILPERVMDALLRREASAVGSSR